ncbi:helix-turn-helix domain-containing protein [Streptomyces sp. NPDC051954]|uniref:PucR family transcriptional regulator n=1 Tax=unclassified Streptomyces TaxID=2593676 RepID=UPI00342EFF50
MTVVQEREPVGEVLRALAVDTDVCGELVRAARLHSPEVARLTEAETRSHVTAIIRAAGAWFGTFDPAARGGFDHVEDQDFAAALLLGADRAGQGVPMTAVLRGVQAALTRAVEITVDRCRTAGVPDRALLALVLRLKEYGDAVERQVINGYRAAERGAPHGVGELRTRLLRRLLTGEVAPSAEELARVGLRPDARRHLVVSDASTRPVRLRGVFGPVEGRLAGLCPRRPTGEEVGDAALVVVSPAVPLEELRRAYRLCVRALEIGGRQGRLGLYDVTDFAAEIALSDQPLLGSYLSDRLLGALDPSDAFHRQLALTALTFLDNGRRLDQTAAMLFTHPNTVRYRLGRLQKITGESLTDLPPESRSNPLSAVHWWWALTTWLGLERAG